MSGEQLAKIIDDLIGAAPSVHERVKAVLRPKELGSVEDQGGAENNLATHILPHTTNEKAETGMMVRARAMSRACGMAAMTAMSAGVANADALADYTGRTINVIVASDFRRRLRFVRAHARASLSPDTFPAIRPWPCSTHAAAAASWYATTRAARNSHGPAGVQHVPAGCYVGDAKTRSSIT